MDLVSILNAFSRPAFIVDEAGVLNLANGAGHHELQQGSYLRLESGRIKPADATVEPSFLASLASAANSFSPASGRGVIRLQDNKGGSLVLFCQPVPTHAAADQGVVLLVDAGHRDPEAESIRIRVAFDLTPAEDRLARELMSGRSLAEAADRHHISRETAKTQLSSLFRKTRTHRQAELVACLLSFLAHGA